MKKDNCNLIGKRIVEIRYKSFLQDGEMCKIILIFFKFDDNTWYSFTTCDGISKINKIDSEPTLYEPISKENEPLYSVNKLLNFRITDYSEIEKIYEYLWKGYSDESLGFLICFTNAKKISIIDNDGCIEIDDKDYTDLEKNVVKKLFIQNCKMILHKIILIYQYNTKHI